MVQKTIEEKRRIRREAVSNRFIFQACQDLNISTFERLRTYSWFAKSKIVAMYVSQPFEFPTRDLFEFCVQKGKTICAPVMQGQDMIFRTIRAWDQTTMNEKNIREPVFGIEISPHRIDLFFVPLVAFDRSGYRLGRGGGNYDRLFADPNVRGTRIGVGFDAQECFSIPKEPHDMPMEYVLTEKRIFHSL